VEGDRFEGENRFARVIYRFDCFLETLRGGNCAELAIGTDNYSYASGYRDSMNASDKRGLLRSYLSDADHVCVASYTNVADIDIVTTSGEVHTG